MSRVVDERFARQLTVPGFGRDQQRRLRDASVLVAGVGGVGGAAATYLAAAGVGRLALVHPGVLELPDLNRQTLMRPSAIGVPRVVTAVATLADHYPDVSVEGHDIEISDPVVTKLIREVDLVVDARHNFPDRYAINRDCVTAQTPLVVAAMGATSIQLLVVAGDSPCFRCVFPEGDPDWEPLGFPVLGAVAGTVGCLAAMEAIKVLTGFGQPSTGRLLAADLLDLSFREYRTVKDPDCVDCGSQVAPRT